MNCFCTLFDSGYLDKGIVLINSLLHCCDDFKLYILAFDEKCEYILKSLNYKNVFVIGLQEFETEEILSIKAKRSHREYCWTCTPFLIEYVLLQCNEEICTYIDADMYFFNSPQVLLEKLQKDGNSIGVIEHRYPNNKFKDALEQGSGKYCVQFNTFIKDTYGMQALRWWKERCAERCCEKSDGKCFGDQLYLNDWLDRFEKVGVVEEHGAGMAPWNICRYRLMNEKKMTIKDIETGNISYMIFYHFHHLVHLSAKRACIQVYTRPGKPQRKLVDLIYRLYLNEIEKTRKMLKDKYGLDFDRYGEVPEFQKSDNYGHLKWLANAVRRLIFEIQLRRDIF